MKNIRIIPSLLLENKRLVKGKKFADHVDSGDPIKTCVAYESQLADEIIIIDLEAHKKKIKPNFEILKDISSECNTPITFGGNISVEEDAIKLIQNGADKIIINSNLKKNSLVNSLSKKFGNQSIVAGVDIIREKESYRVLTNGVLSTMNPLKEIAEILSMDIGELKITFIDYEGMKKGFDFTFAKQILDSSTKPIIFEGGIGTLEDINYALEIGIDSIALGHMITFGDNNIFKIKQFLQNKKFELRLRD
tara:strand:+ start:805 stop:1554 length:750 start_codon:yes stop_codon:yes gene_type:complete